MNTFIALSAASVAMIFCFSVFMVLFPGAIQALMGPGTAGTGPYVAEVWLDWEICRGSTMYRQRFENKETAELFAKNAARYLDWILPTHWRTTDWSGRPYFEKYGYAIKFGVRSIDVVEDKDFQVVWATRLPGQQGITGAGYGGEHREAHPLMRKAQQSTSTSEGLLL
jgi:hypothetical protein